MTERTASDKRDNNNSGLYYTITGKYTGDIYLVHTRWWPEDVKFCMPRTFRILDDGSVDTDFGANKRLSTWLWLAGQQSRYLVWKRERGRRAYDRSKLRRQQREVRRYQRRLAHIDRMKNDA